MLIWTLFALFAQQAVFQSTTQLVVETVVVKDKSGKPVSGLSAKDFTITEDGVVQAIKFFEHQKFDETLAPREAVTRRVAPFPRLTKTQIAAESPGDVRYRDRRLLAFYFDMT